MNLPLLGLFAEPDSCSASHIQVGGANGAQRHAAAAFGETAQANKRPPVAPHFSAQWAAPLGYCPTMTSSASAHDEPLDPATVGAIAIVAYCLANLIHEGGGHGGACLLVGGRPVVLNAIFFQCDLDTLAPAAARAVSAGGSILNIVVAALLLGVVRVWRRPPADLRYFLWLLTALNLLTAFGYLLFSGIGGFGDWAAVIAGLPSASLLRVTEIAAGGLLYFYVAPRLLWPGLRPFLGSAPAQAVERARRLTLFPYLLGGVTYVAAGLLNPYGLKLILLSAAAASFGGTSLLAWYFTMRAARPLLAAPSTLGIRRRGAWMVAALLALVGFIGVLGRGIRL